MDHGAFAHQLPFIGFLLSDALAAESVRRDGRITVTDIVAAGCQRSGLRTAPNTAFVTSRD